MKSLEEIRTFFDGDKYATEQTGIVIEEAQPGYSKVMLKLQDRHKNALHQVMGAVYFTMVDFAFAVASNCEMGELATVTLSSQINFIGVPKTDKLYAVAKVKKDGNKTSLYEITITDSDDNEIAVAISNGYKIKNRF